MSSSPSVDVGRCTLPPDHTFESFRHAIEAFRDVLGANNIELITTEEIEDGTYFNNPKAHDPWHIVDQDEFVASAIVRPGCTEDVSKILKTANEHNVPLWPISIGRNYGYGGGGPRVRGSIIVDLGHRMNKILDLNESGAFALVEPGVTFHELYSEIKRRNLPFLLDVPDLGFGSVIGNTTERGVGNSPYGDHFMIHCGMEVVLPNGDVIRTGMGALPDETHPTGSANTWQLFPYGFGPYHDGIFTQSNFGIVTKMGYWLMPDPGGVETYMITFENDSDLPRIIDTMRPLRLANILQNSPCLRNAIMDLAVVKARAEFSDTGKLLTEEEINIYRKEIGVGRWTLYGGLYGPDAVRQTLWATIKGAFEKIPGAKAVLHHEVTTYGAKEIVEDRQRLQSGIPGANEYKVSNWVPNGSVLFVSPISAVNGEQATAQALVARRLCEEYGLDYNGIFVQGLRELHHLILVMFNREDKEEKSRAMTMIRRLVDDCAAHGWGEYRTHLSLMDQIAGTYCWNDGAVMKLNEKLKDTLDPNGILAPGKSGIWPKKYREVRKANAIAPSNLVRHADIPVPVPKI